MRLQDKFIAMVNKTAEERGLELVHDSEWSNTGTLRVQRSGDFDDIVALNYNFQTDYATFTMFWSENFGQESTKSYYTKKPTELNGVLRDIDRVLDGKNLMLR